MHPLDSPTARRDGYEVGNSPILAGPNGVADGIPALVNPLHLGSAYLRLESIVPTADSLDQFIDPRRQKNSTPNTCSSSQPPQKTHRKWSRVGNRKEIMPFRTLSYGDFPPGISAADLDFLSGEVVMQSVEVEDGTATSQTEGGTSDINFGDATDNIENGDDTGATRRAGSPLGTFFSNGTGDDAAYGGAQKYIGKSASAEWVNKHTAPMPPGWAEPAAFHLVLETPHILYDVFDEEDDEGEDPDPEIKQEQAE